MSESNKQTVRELQLEPSWREILGDEFEKSYMLSLQQFLMNEKAQGQEVFPAGKDIFAALNSTTFSAVKVVILGQDPYHGPGQAHGLSFSVNEGVAIPPSLRNIYKELQADVDFNIPSHGNLLAWAAQGVLLLNSVLTVRAGQAGSHQGKGWEAFTDAIIDKLNHGRDQLVFLLWGNYAQKKGSLIDQEQHLVLTSPHPSPLSASRGFFNNHHFSTANQYLRNHGFSAIDWQL